MFISISGLLSNKRIMKYEEWTEFLKNLFILIGGSLLYNIMVASAIHQHESATAIHVSPHPEPPLPLPSLPHPSGSKWAEF